MANSYLYPTPSPSYRAWENPNLLFLMMGVLTIGAMIGTYTVALRYENPLVVIGSVSLVAMLMLVVGGIIIKAIERIVRADMLKTEFVNIASHQLRTPLSAIRWTLDLVLSPDAKDSLSKSQEEHLKTVYDSTERMITLVNSLLDVSRYESGKLKLHPERVDLLAVVRASIRGHQALADASNAAIEVHVKGESKFVYADSERLQIVVDNLLANAVKYIDRPGRVDVTLSRSGRWVKFIVKDTGVGIPKSEHGRIFQKFFRAENAMRRQTTGSGLGLFVSRAIVQASGGDIGFSSVEGNGSTFWFRLPACRERG